MQKRFEVNVFKKRVLHFLPFVLIFVGVILIISVVAMKWKVEEEQKRMIATYNSALNEESQQVTSIDTSLDEASTGEIEANATKPICLLQIPKIDLYVAVSEGVDKKILRYAVGHFSNTAVAGDLGNFCLVGHRSYAYGEFFNRLDELEIGDDIYAERNGTKYTYTVTKKFVVDPEDTWVLDQTTDAEITLITCTPIRVATQRLIIKGVLKESSPS